MQTLQDMHIINPRKTTTLIAYVRSEHDLLNEPSVMPEEERACFCLPMLLSNGGSITECFYLTGISKKHQARYCVEKQESTNPEGSMQTLQDMHIINPRKTTTLIAYVRSEHDLLNEPSVMPEEERACFCLPMLLSNGGSITECFCLTGQTRV